MLYKPQLARRRRHEHRNCNCAGDLRPGDPSQEKHLGQGAADHRHRPHRHLLPGAVLLDTGVLAASRLGDLRQYLVASPSVDGELPGSLPAEQQLSARLAELPHCLRRSDGHCSAHRHLRVLRARAPRFPRQGRIPHSHHRDVDVPTGGHHRAAAEELLGMALD